jgi:hypothetical protein
VPPASSRFIDNTQIWKGLDAVQTTPRPHGPNSIGHTHSPGLSRFNKLVHEADPQVAFSVCNPIPSQAKFSLGLEDVSVPARLTVLRSLFYGQA